MYSCTGVVILSKATVRNLLAAILTALFSITLADAVFHISSIINPGVSNIYNALGTQIAPNMVTVVIFDFRAYDTLGESIMSQGSMILKLISLPISIILICLGIMTILGGHITPGGGFQGGAMIASGIILSILVYGLGNSPLELSHTYIEVLESVGALGFVIFGLIGLFVGGFYLYNVGTDVLNIVPAAIQNVFHYPDVTNAGIIPYLNIFVGLKVFVGLSSIVIAFAGFKKIVEESE